jgi:hypothetical protein
MLAPDINTLILLTVSPSRPSDDRPASLRGGPGPPLLYDPGQLLPECRILKTIVIHTVNTFRNTISLWK